jgi:hypothetical protein
MYIQRRLVAGLDAPAGAVFFMQPCARHVRVPSANVFSLTETRRAARWHQIRQVAFFTSAAAKRRSRFGALAAPTLHFKRRIWTLAMSNLTSA